MNKFIFAFIMLVSSYSFADSFVCNHQDSNGNEYNVEYLNGSICMKKVTDDGEVKFNLFPAPNPEEQGGLIIFRDDENSFRLSLSHYPSSGDPASGEIVHTNESGEEIQENMSTYCN